MSELGDDLELKQESNSADASDVDHEKDDAAENEQISTDSVIDNVNDSIKNSISSCAKSDGADTHLLQFVANWRANVAEEISSTASDEQLVEIDNLNAKSDDTTSNADLVLRQLTSIQRLYQIKWTRVESSINTLESTNEGLKNQLQELNAEVKSRGEKIHKLEEDADRQAHRFSQSEETWKEKAANDKELLDNTASQLGEKERMIESQQREIDNLDMEVASCREKMQQLETDASKAKDSASEQLIATRTENQILTSSLKQVQAELALAQQEQDSTKEELAVLKSDSQRLTEQLADLEGQKSELANNCSQLNSVFNSLKSTLKAAHVDAVSDNGMDSQLNAKLEGESESEHVIEMAKSIVEKMDALKKRNIELTREVENIKKLDTSHEQEHDDERSDNVSTSTVSRVEESARMRDVEDSFEDRYSKLKLVAIKLKKKVAEQSKVIEELQKKKGSGGEAVDHQACREKVATISSNFAKLQAEHDQLMDRYETVQKKHSEMSKDLERTVEDAVKSKQKAEESLESAVAAKKALTELEAQLRKANTDLIVAREGNKVKEEEILSLTTKLEETRGREANLKEQLADKCQTDQDVSASKQQIKYLEETLAKEEERANRAQESLTATRIQLDKVEVELKSAKLEIADSSRKVQDNASQLENAKLQSVSLIADLEKKLQDERNAKTQLQRHISTLENKLVVKAEEFEKKCEEFDKITKDFEGYKLRAQSVLKQAKEQSDRASEKKATDELKAFEKINSGLQSKIENLSSEIKALSNEKLETQNELDRLMERHSSLIQDLAQKEKSWRKKSEEHDVERKKIGEEKQLMEDKWRREMLSLKEDQQRETAFVATNHAQEVDRLKRQLDNAENEIIKLQLSLQKEQTEKMQMEDRLASHRPNSMDRLTGHAHGSLDRLDISQMEREAAEGQEVDPDSPGHINSPLHLEQLLHQSEEPEQGDVRALRSELSSRQGDAEKQVAHISLLLAESEAQNNRLEKLVEVLKEEIRTYQRSEERSKHIENLEYMKNVILKFLTLGGEERARLIPVIATMLRLSKQEVEKIQQLAKVEDSKTSPSNEGWTTYLNLWST